MRVVASVSQPLDRFVLEDAPALRDFLSAELVDAVRRAIEYEVVNGDGSGEHFTGLNNISGVQTIPAAADLLAGVRTAITKLQTVSIQPSFVAVNPSDLEAAQLKRNTSGAFDWAVDGAPVDAGRAQAWGVTLIPTPAVPSKTAWAIGEDAIQLSTDGQVRVDWGLVNDNFVKNEITLRAETRANLDALRPSGLVKITMVP